MYFGPDNPVILSVLGGVATMGLIAGAAVGGWEYRLAWLVATLIALVVYWVSVSTRGRVRDPSYCLCRMFLVVAPCPGVVLG